MSCKHSRENKQHEPRFDEIQDRRFSTTSRVAAGQDACALVPRTVTRLYNLKARPRARRMHPLLALSAELALYLRGYWSYNTASHYSESSRRRARKSRNMSGWRLRSGSVPFRKCHFPRWCAPRLLVLGPYLAPHHAAFRRPRLQGVSGAPLWPRCNG